VAPFFFAASEMAFSSQRIVSYSIVKEAVGYLLSPIFFF
jgi:hypothetical protein